MNVRERMEQEEYEFLSPQAQKAAETKGRPEPEDDNDVRTCYQRDADRILHSKSFRRLMHKTQVFLSPEGDHYRTRMTHTLEVARIARTICRGLRLNQDLAEAAAYGHDLGHTPFGHAGEKALSSMLDKPFRHNEQSLRVVEVLEKDGDGLNLTREVRDGILCHSGKQLPFTLEGECVRRADRIAYLNHDLDDALRAGVLRPFELPVDCLKVLGNSHGERIDTMIRDVVQNSQEGKHLHMSDRVQAAMDGLREFMFEKVYRDAWRAAEEGRCDHVMKGLFHYYSEHPGEMPNEFLLIGYREGMDRAVCDFLSCMTDRYAVRQYQSLFIPGAFPLA